MFAQVSQYLRSAAIGATLVLSVSSVFAQTQSANGIFAPGVDPNEVAGPMLMSDMALVDVLDRLEAYTGRIVLRPQSLPTPAITINAKAALTRAEAVFAIETSLALNGIGIVPSDEKFLKVVQVTSVRTEAPELIIGSLRGQPASGKVVSKVFQLQHIDTATFQQQAGQLLSTFGSIVPFANSNSVLVTDTVANIQRLEYIVEQVDRRVPIEPKFYQIRYADAGDLASAINQMLDQARSRLQGTTGGAAPRIAIQPGQQGGPQAVSLQTAGGGDSGVSLQSVISSNSMITADDRTNQLIVITNPVNLPFFDNLIEKLDIAADPLTSIEVIPLNYADAEELASVVSSVISGRSGTQNADRQPTRNAQRGGTASQANAAQPNTVTTTPTLPQRLANAANAAQSVVDAENGQFSQLVQVQSDIRTNAIIVAGTTSDIALIRRVVQQLDIILPQVRIDVVIAEVTLGKNLQRGIDAFSPISYDRTTGEITVGINTSSSSGSTTPAGPIGAIVSGVLSGGVLTDYTIDAVINAARTNSDVNLLSVPTIVTTHNQPATVLFGEQRPVITGTTSGGVSGTVQSQYSYQDIPIQLDVTPIIGPNDVVQLEITQTVNAVTDFEVIDGNNVPVISRREASSYLTVKNGQLIVLGGLQRSFDSKTKSRMFILGEIPILGEIFSKTITQLNKTDLLIFLKPTVIRGTENADQNARESIDRVPTSKANAPVLRQVTGGSDEDAKDDAESDTTSRGPAKPGPR